MGFLYNRTCKFLFSAFLVIALNISVKAQLTATGDLVFTGWQSSGFSATTDQFAFVVLKSCPVGTVIKFTDNAWNSGSLTFNTTEANYVFTVTGATIPAGTEIRIIIGPPAVALFTTGLSAGTVVATGAFSMPTTGEQMIAYLGPDLAPTVFLSGIHMNVESVCGVTTAAGWDPASCVFPILPTNNSSMKPAALTTDVNAFWSTVEHDNGRFICGALDLSTPAAVRAAVNNPANWFFEDPAGAEASWSPNGPFSYCNFLGILSSPPTFTLHPVNTTVCEGANTSFTITATSATSYQWQVDNGGGFANISNNATYSGATTTTLNITAATNSLNGFIYRCVATNGFGSTNSNPATLTVTALPVNPTLLLKTPATGTVADGTPVSATFNAGSGGSGCTDDYRYTTDGGTVFTAYTPGANISTTGVAAGSGFVFIEGRRAGCATCSGSYVVLASWVVTPLPAGATTLNAGDIGFTGYASNYPTIPEDNFSFVLLKNIGPGTVVNFTNNGWLSTNVFGVGEETLTWTSNAAYPAGTEIKIIGLTATLASGGSAGTVTGAALNFATTGDQILAYRGLPATPTFISAIHMNVEAGSTAAAWDGAVVSTNASALPTGLTTGTNCIWIGTAGDLASEFDNARYGTCAGPGTLGPITTLRAALNNQANWIRDNNQPPSFVLPTGCPYLGVGAAPNITGQPSNATVCELANTNFTITATGATIYQWQVDNGGGYVNVTNNANYSGATTATLNLIATPLSFNGYIYRCIASNGSGSSTSNPATLTVTALPVSPTLLAKTPAGLSVADGTPVSATFNAGSGGTGCADDFRYTIDGGTTYLPYTPGANISTTGLAAASGFVFIEGRRAGCASLCQGSYSVLAFWRVTPFPAAPTTLNAGDIAFSGYASTAVPDEFSFVLLRNIGPGTVINFTDNGWLSTNVFGVGEQTVTWTAPAGGLHGGTEIKIASLTATRSGGGAAGIVTGVALSLTSTGDQVLAYRGAPATPTFISAIHMNVEPGSTVAAWDGAVVSNNASALPTGLTSGVNCIWIGTPGNLASEFSNSRYGNCSGPGILGPLTGLRAALNNQANWISDDNTPPSFTLPTGCNYLLAICPVITVTNPVNTTGTIGVAFSETFTSSGGVPPVTFTTASTLPTGITLSTAGVLSGTPTQTGPFPIIVLATDLNGCTGVGATYNLVINCQTITVTNPVNTSGTINIAFSETFTQTGGVLPVTFTLNSGSLPAGLTLSPAGVLSGTPTVSGPFSITVRATDANGCFANGPTYNLVISSCIAPAFTACPSNISLNNTTGLCSRIVSYTVTASGTPAPTFTYSFTGATTASGSGDGSGSSFNVGVTNVSVTATNTCGAPVCSFTVTINDTQAPTLTCPGPVTVSCASAVPAPNIASVTGVTDNCPAVVTVTHQGDVISAQTCANRYTITRTYRATDAATNFAECTQIITVNDITLPSLTCPGPVTVSCASAVPAANIALVTGVSDNCGGVVTVTHQGDVISAQTCANRYTITRTYRATDVCGNFAECTQIITVNDITLPSLTCPGPVTVSCASAVPAANIALVTGVSDNCGGVVTVTHQGDVISAQTCANRYTITRTYRATDVCGNFAECTQIITVNDQTAPALTCPAPVTVSCAGDVPAPDINAVTGVSDNCGGVVTVTHQGDVISAQTCANRYTITRTYRATDVCGNFAECTQIITVNDVTPPTLTCSGPVTVSCASAVPAPNIATVTGVSDNCVGAITVTHQGDVISAQTCANRYTITRTYRATDVCGNFAECTQIITVDDQTPPLLTCPGDITISCASAVPAPNIGSVTGVSDNCGGVVTISHQGDVISAQTCANRYTIQRKYRATDVCGNFTECIQIINVNDQTPPVLTCPAPVTVSCASAVPAPNIGSVTGVSDNCGGVVTITHEGDVITNLTCANRYTITRTYRATDVCGNFAQCTQIITVNDQTPPVLTCPGPVTVSCASAVPAPNIGSVTGVSDNCGGVVTVTHQGDVISAQTCANRYTITRTYRATDVCGNFAECTQVITVNDQTPPVLTCPGPVTVSCAGDVPAPNIALVTGVSDNCGGVVTVTHQGDVISAQTCANRYTITRTYRATDVCGNFAQCTQIITVNDQTPPVLTCPGPVTVSCAGDVPAPNVASVSGVSDNCGGVVTVTHVGDVISNQTCANRFTITRTYRATDVCGNFAQCTQIITVNDQTGPVITCPANITVSTPLSSCTAEITYNVTATDNCAGVVTIVSTPASGFAFPIGVTIVTSTATDVCGNSSTCTFTVTVIDSRPPVITTQPVNRTVCVGASATFSVVATNTVSYQWQTGNINNQWGNIPGATSSTFTVNNAPLSMNNSLFRVALTGPCGTVVYSNVVNFVVNPLPLITLTSSGFAVLLPNRSITITANANPPGGSYVWLFNGSPMTGITGSSLGPLTVMDVGTYNVIYTDLNGCVSTSLPFNITAGITDYLWVYPNPNAGQFNVRFYNQTGEAVTLKVFNALGQEVYAQSLALGIAYSNITVNMSNAAAGVYIVKIMNGTGAVLNAKRIFVYHP